MLRPKGQVAKPQPGAPVVSVIVCIHNALEDVWNCISSVLETEVDVPWEMILVDDGSEEPTAAFVRETAANHDHVRALRNEKAGGYTVAANTGLRAARGRYLALLNSDTIVPKRWLEKIIKVFETHRGVGIVGPLSNAASWQSVPQRSRPEGGWAINSLPDGWSVDQMDSCVERAALGLVYPRVPLANGFCYCIHRDLLDAIGLLDEAAFPRGFGEEDDYCLRAANAGFGAMLAIDTYVFHAKSKSYGSAQRDALSKRGQGSLKKKHGAARLKRSTETMKINPSLAEMRHRVSEMTPS